MRNNHRQSIKIISDSGALLSARKETGKDYEDWLTDERSYYKALRKESPLDQLKTKYATVRLDLEAQQCVSLFYRTVSGVLTYRQGRISEVRGYPRGATRRRRSRRCDPSPPPRRLQREGAH